MALQPQLQPGQEQQGEGQGPEAMQVGEGEAAGPSGSLKDDGPLDPQALVTGAYACHVCACVRVLLRVCVVGRSVHVRLD